MASFEAKFRRPLKGRTVELPLSTSQDGTRCTLLSALRENPQDTHSQTKTFPALPRCSIIDTPETQRLLKEGSFLQVKAERTERSNFSGELHEKRKKLNGCVQEKRSCKSKMFLLQNTVKWKIMSFKFLKNRSLCSRPSAKAKLGTHPEGLVYAETFLP